jgi:hypothetical protein
MNWQEAQSIEAPSRDPKASWREEYVFEAIFDVSPTHRLEVVRSRSRGGNAAANYWDHEEYDTSGCLIARYRSFEETSAQGVRHSGWRKFDGAGRLVTEGAICP